ncbi:MAG: nicotinate phosphoribosyltransferase [Bacteriovoracaceae bacterium]
MLRSFINYSGTFVDFYEISMGQVYYKLGRLNEMANFDYFFRKSPYNSGYVIFAGLNDILKILEKIRFTQCDLDWLQSQGFDDDYLTYLRNFRFQGKIFSCEEGEIIFPHIPALRVEANLIEAQMIETLLLNLINFQSLIATKASRVRSVAKDVNLLEFGLRRAQGPGGYYASRASIIGGFDSTSNVKAAIDFEINCTGTMAHSFIQSEKNEYLAFKNFSELRPEGCVLLIDTYNTLESGLPNAIRVAKEMERKNHKLFGVRIDSGDLSYLAKECRHQLNLAGLQYVKIIASNQLDELVIKSLIDEGAPIDVFGVGTSIATGSPDAALDGVYKLSQLNLSPRMKTSDTIKKTSLPGKKQVYRLMDQNRFLGADVIALDNEDPNKIQSMHNPFDAYAIMDLSHCAKEPLLKLVMKNGRRISPSPSIQMIKSFSQKRLDLLDPEYKRFKNPHIYKVGISPDLKTLRDDLIYKNKR